MALAGMCVQETCRLQIANLGPRWVQMSKMGLGRRAEEDQEAGDLEMLHLVRRRSDVMTRWHPFGPKSAHNGEDIRQQWLLWYFV